MIKNFFSHDMDASDDDKLCALMSEFGAAGYAVYFMLVEKLHKDHPKLPKVINYIYRNIAAKCKIDADTVMKIIKMAIEECDLFVQDETHFWSERVLRNIEIMGIKSKSASDRGKLGARIKQEKKDKLTSSYSLANAEQQLSYSLANGKLTQAKEIKRKENKTNKENINHKHIVRSDFCNIHFDKFWDAYHPAGRVSKKKTIEIWHRQNLDNHVEQILNHLSELRKTPNWIIGQYIPHATTFLSQERWKELVIIQEPTAMMHKEEVKKAMRDCLDDPFSTHGEIYEEKIIESLD